MRVMAIGNGERRGGGQPQPEPPPPLVTSASPSFKLVLLLVFSLTAAAMVTSTSLATWGQESEQTKHDRRLLEGVSNGPRRHPWPDRRPRPVGFPGQERGLWPGPTTARASRCATSTVAVLQAGYAKSSR